MHGRISFQSYKMLLIHVLIFLILHQSEACSYDNRLIVSEGYNEADPPTLPTTKVETSLKFRHFDAVDDSQKTFTFTAIIFLHWIETRIRMKPEFHTLRKPRTFSNCIWSPTLLFLGQVQVAEVNYIYNNLEVAMINVGNDSISIQTRFQVQVKVNCPDFEFHWFPLDQQVCSVVLFSASPGSTLDGLVDVVATLSMNDVPLEYDVTNKSIELRDLPNSGKSLYGYQVSYVGTRLHFKRRTPPYYGYFVFSELIVCISWITYWIPYTSYPGRLAPLFILLLTLVSTFIKVRGVVPTCMNSITIIEIYILVCIFQVFFVILAYAHILIAIHHLKSTVSTNGMDPKIIEEKKVLKINRIYHITSPVLNICMWIVIALYLQFG